MLTLKLISEQTERVIAGLEKKHFKGAREAIEEVMAVDKRRRETQQTLDNNLSEAKKMAAQIGQLMKQSKRDEAEQIKATVAQMKETNKKLEADKAAAEDELTTLLCHPPFCCAAYARGPGPRRRHSCPARRRPPFRRPARPPPCIAHCRAP